MRIGMQRLVVGGWLVFGTSVVACSGDKSPSKEEPPDAGEPMSVDSGNFESDAADSGESDGDGGRPSAVAVGWANGKILSVKDVDIVIVQDGTARAANFTISQEVQEQAPFRAVDSDLGSYCLLDDSGRFVCSLACAEPPAGTGYTDLALSRDAILGLTPQGRVVASLCSGVAVNFREENDYVQLEGRDSLQCALHRSGRIDCFESTFARSFSIDGAYVDFAVGSNHVCGLAQDGGVSCLNKDGRTSDRPEASPPRDDKFSRIAAGVGVTCAIRTSDRAVTCWGSHTVADQAGPFVELAATGGRGCGILEDGKVVCWGSGDRFKDLTARLK